jgi:hypothetical protein
MATPEAQSAAVPTASVEDAREEAFVLALSDVELIPAAGILNQERERQHDHALAAHEGEEVPPHIEAVRDVVEVLDEGQARRREAAHNVEHRVEVGAVVAGKPVRQRRYGHDGDPGESRRHHAVRPGGLRARLA